jgi:hypothetical protein
MGCWVPPKIIGVSNGLPFVLSRSPGSFRKKHIFIDGGGPALMVFRLAGIIFFRGADGQDLSAVDEVRMVGVEEPVTTQQYHAAQGMALAGLK